MDNSLSLAAKVVGSNPDHFNSIFFLFCVACKAWWAHKDHVSVGVVGVVSSHTFGFRSITFEGIHQFHSNFTE